MIFLFIVLFLFCFGIAVIGIIATWKVFAKAGQPGWASIIPIYNIYIMTKIAGKPGWWTLLCLIPFFNFIFIVWIYNMISKSFGKDEAFTVGLVLLGIVFWPILAFSDARYLGPYGDPTEFHARQARFDFEQNNPNT